LQRHPLTDRPIIDWDLILVMVPLTLVGALLGAFINKLLPGLVIIMTLVLLLSFTAYTTLQKAYKMYQKETQSLKISEQQQQHQQQIQQQPSELMPLTLKDDNQAYDTILSTTTGANNDFELAKIIDNERTTPIQNLLLLIITFGVVLVINLLKGGGSSTFPSPIGIACGSISFYLINLFLVVWVFCISIYVRHYLIKKTKTKNRLGYKYVKGDVQWDETNTIKYGFYSIVAGIFAGMFGIGKFEARSTFSIDS
jgi:uncharacterized membrane protein YfcA